MENVKVHRKSFLELNKYNMIQKLTNNHVKQLYELGDHEQAYVASQLLNTQTHDLQSLS